MSDKLPLILLPGLGADERMFSSMRGSLPQISTPRWIEPVAGESVAEYARRFAPEVDPGKPFLIGGASFGGVVAQELAALLPNAKLCFVIGSATSEKSRPWHIRILRPITPFIGILPWIAPYLVKLVGVFLRAPTRGVLMQLGATNPRFLRWGAQAVLRWKPSPGIANVNVVHIHGDMDKVFPLQLAKPDHIVAGAGHLIAITHYRQVADLIRQQIESLESEPD